MNRYLCISITFLDPLFHGQADQGQPEWPPSPLRLFQAMLAGTSAGCRKADWSDDKAEAFRWLECLDPPEIVSPQAVPGNSYILFVPNNDTDKKLQRHERLTSKNVRPHRLIDGQTLHYLWPIPEETWRDPVTRTAAELICRSARDILALGWGVDMVVAHGRILNAIEARALQGRRWRPWKDIGTPDFRRRVPKQGTLVDLQRVYRSFTESIKGRMFFPPSKPVAFDLVTYRPVTAMPPRFYAVFELHNTRGNWQAFPQTDTALVAAMLRHQACNAAMDDTHRFEGGTELYVAGHVQDQEHSPPRFSYLPLPTIRPQGQADGMIRRVLIAEHYGGEGRHAYWAQSRLRGAVLVDINQRPRAVLAPAQPADQVLRLYVQPSRTWATVTPVALPGYDDGKHLKAERLFLKAVHQAGLPIEAVAEFTLQKAPFWSGSHHPSLYRRPQDYLQRCPLWHARITFKEEIHGPLSIGAGRHCGLGLFAATHVARTVF